MSTSIENLRRIAERSVEEHTALFDLYVTVGRDIDYLAIRFGIDPDELINLLEAYGEKLRITTADIEKDPALATEIMENKATVKAIEEFGIALNYSGKGRYKKLSRLLIEEYVEKFYPGIASENPENDWICLEAYLDRFHPGWKGQIGQSSLKREDRPEDANQGTASPKKTSKRKVRNNFKLF